MASRFAARRARTFGLLLFLALFACDRRIEPFDPAEVPANPDLSRIFPEGAEQAAEQPLFPEPPAADGDSGDAAPIRGTIRLAEGLEGRVPAGAVLYLIARSGEAGPPVAVQRIASPRFPLAFAIGPEDRMIQSMPFQGPLRLSARIDADGDAGSRQAGDLQGAAPGSHHPGEDGVAVVIDEVFADDAARATPPPGAAAAASAEPIRGTVTLAEGLGDRVPVNAVLFVVARTAAAGPPLAVLRIPSPHFPFAFAIGPEDRMIQSRPFVGPIELSARVDGDGDASTRDPGDLQGVADGALQPGDRDVPLLIDEVL